MELLEKLEQVHRKFLAISAELENPAIALDQAKYQSLLRERHQLLGVEEGYHRFARITRELSGAREVLDETRDPELRAMAEEELRELEIEYATASEEIKYLLIPADPNDSRNSIIEIRAGTGGEEAALFAGDLYRMYSRFAERHGASL